MLPNDFVRAVAHGAAAELLRLAVQPADTETVGVAVITGHVRIVVSLTRDAGPMTIEPEVLAKIKAFGAPALTELQWRALSVLSLDKPTKGEVIAMRIGRQCGGSFRGMLSQLVRMQFATHINRAGYVLTQAGHEAVLSAPFNSSEPAAK